MSGKLITKDNFKEFIKKQEKPFNCEFTFQFALAWYLKEKCKDEGIKCDVEFESKEAYTDDTMEGNRKSRCDLVFTLNDSKKIYIELKYIYHSTKEKNKGTSTTSVGARKFFIKDLTRLKEKIDKPQKTDEKFCIFLTNWPICYEKQKGERTKNINEVLKIFNDNYRDKSKWINCNIKEEQNFKCLILNVNNEEPSMHYDEVMVELNKDNTENEQEN